MNWKDVDTTHCGIAACTDIIGDRWSLLLLRDIFQGVRRFQELQEHLGVSSTIVADRLKKLTHSGILEKSEYQAPGERARAEYILTPKGKSLGPVLIALAQFGYEHLIEKENRLITHIDTRTGEPVRLAMVDKTGQAVPHDQVEAVINPAALSAPD